MLGGSSSGVPVVLGIHGDKKPKAPGFLPTARGLGAASEVPRARHMLVLLDAAHVDAGCWTFQAGNCALCSPASSDLHAKESNTLLPGIPGQGLSSLILVPWYVALVLFILNGSIPIMKMHRRVLGRKRELRP